MWTLAIQNHSKLPITEKKRYKAKYLTWDSSKLKFVKKTSISEAVKSLRYIKCYSSSSPRPVKSPSISKGTDVRRSVGDREDLKLYWKSEKRPHFYRWSTILLFTSFSKTLLTTERTLTGRYFLAVDLSILEYRDQHWKLPTIRKTSLLQTLITGFS